MSELVVGVRIELRNIRPKIWRRVVVPVSTTLFTLHETIQVAFGWWNYHLWDFEVQGENFGPPSDDHFSWDLPMHDAMDFDLDWVVSKGIKRFLYTYDFGDDWQHDVILGVVRKVNKCENYPILVGGARNGPPEDVGGFSGYWTFVDSSLDPSHESHEENKEWYDGEYDPEEFDAEELSQKLKRIHIEN